MTLSISWQFKQHLTIMLTIMFIFSSPWTCRGSWKHCVHSTLCCKWKQGTWACKQLLLITELPSFQHLRCSVAPVNRPEVPISRYDVAIRGLSLGTPPVVPICSAPSASTPPGWQTDELSGMGRTGACASRSPWAAASAGPHLQDAQQECSAFLLLTLQMSAKWFWQVCSEYVCVYVYI